MDYRALAIHVAVIKCSKTVYVYDIPLVCIVANGAFHILIF